MPFCWRSVHNKYTIIVAKYVDIMFVYTCVLNLLQCSNLACRFSQGSCYGMLFRVLAAQVPIHMVNKVATEEAWKLSILRFGVQIFRIDGDIG